MRPQDRHPLTTGFRRAQDREAAELVAARGRNGGSRGVNTMLRAGAGIGKAAAGVPSPHIAVLGRVNGIGLDSAFEADGNGTVRYGVARARQRAPGRLW